MTASLFSGPDNQPTEAEKRLIEAARDGGFAECKELPNDERTVSAELIAALATNTFQHPDGSDWKLHPNGVRLEDARIPELLDLENRKVPTALIFGSCTFEGGLDLDDAHIEGALMLDRCTVKGTCRLYAARIAGQFNANGACFDNTAGEGSAIFAQDAQAAGWYMDNAEVKGRFDINSARIAGQFNANGACFDNADGEGNAVEAQAVQAADWFMNGAEVKGRFNIAGARIAGQFTADRVCFANADGEAVFAEDAQADAWFMNDAEVKGRFNINGARIAGQFGAESACFDNTDGEGNAVQAQAVQVADWLMNDAEVKGRFNIAGARIAGHFNAMGAQFQNAEGIALEASWVRINENVFLRTGKKKTQVQGQCYLGGAVIGKMLDLSGAEFIGQGLPPLILETATVDGDVTLDGASVTGAVVATRAHFKGAVDLRGAILKAVARKGHAEDDPTRGYALFFQDARIDVRLIMPERCPEGIVDLTRARCGVLEDFASGWSPPLARRAKTNADRRSDEKGDMQHLVLNGFEYGYLEHPDGQNKSGGSIGAARKDWLAGQAAAVVTAHLNPQPWRQAAKVLHEMGHDTAAKEVSIEHRVREREAKDTKPFERFVSGMLHALADYGFNPWKTVIISLGVVFACTFLYWVGSLDCAVEGGCDSELFVEVRYHGLKPGAGEAGAYPSLDSPLSLLIYSLDAFIPFYGLGSQSYWTINTDTWTTRALGLPMPIGWMLYILYVFQRIAGAVLIAIAVTGFTGVLTRDAYSGDRKS